MRFYKKQIGSLTWYKSIDSESQGLLLMLASYKKASIESGWQVVWDECQEIKESEFNVALNESVTRIYSHVPPSEEIRGMLVPRLELETV